MNSSNFPDMIIMSQLTFHWLIKLTCSMYCTWFPLKSVHICFELFCPFWKNTSIQIMNVYECSGTNILWGERWNVPFKETKPSWVEHFIFHQMILFVSFHEWENIHYLFYITCTKIQFLNQFKTQKQLYLKQKTLHKTRV